MFTKARLKLTGWYLLIVMFISISFSLVIYQVSNSELNRVLRIDRLRQQQRLSAPVDFLDQLPRRTSVTPPDPQLIEETKERLWLILLGINLTIFGVSGVLGYFLAGRTLTPIKIMLEEQNRFITDASHELRTPLTSLRSEIEVNLRDEKLNLNQAKDLLKSNLEEVDNLQTLSDNLIRLTQYQKGNHHMTFEEINLMSVIKEAERKVASMAKVRKISIKVKGRALIMDGEKQTLIELFAILLDNAIKYSPNNTKVTVSCEQTDHSALVEVADQGIGIEEKDLPRIFERFYRVDKSRTKQSLRPNGLKADVAGYGLGLSIAKQIVEKHDGSIKVTSEVAKGTVFSIQLPIKHTTATI